MKRLKFMSFTLAWMACASLLLAQEADIRKSPGYFELDGVRKMFDAEPTLEINLKGFLLSMAAGATKYSDPELAGVLDNLTYVRVERYDLPHTKRQDIRGRNSDLAKSLDKGGWERIVRVRENNDDVYVYLKPNEKQIAGIVVLAIDGADNVLFANIVGNIDPEQIGRLGGRWDIDHLDSIRWEYNRKK